MYTLSTLLEFVNFITWYFSFICQDTSTRTGANQGAFSVIEFTQMLRQSC